MVLYEQGEAIYRYDEPTNLVSLLEGSVSKYSNNKLFGVKKTDNTYQWITYQEFGTSVDNLRSGLSQLNILNKDDTIGIIANNRPEWAMVAFATYGLHCRFVPMYEKELETVWKYIINDAEIKILFVANKDIYDKVLAFKNELITLKKIFIIDGEFDNSLANLLVKGKEKKVPSVKPLPDDIAALIYTSGTTGDPKGVLLSHGNFTSNAQAGWAKFPDLDENCRALSILPWAHSYAQTAELYNFIQFGGSIGIMGSLETLSDDFKLVKPTHLICVPRLFHKIYDGIFEMINEKGGMTKKLFYAAIKEADKVRKTGKSSLKYKLLNKLVLKKVRANFGGKLHTSLTASAKTSKEVIEFFFNIGLPIYDCYGLTETSPAVTINCPTDYRIGSVGKVIEKVKVVIDTSVVEEGADDGEIIVYGPNVMKGYYKKEKKTKEVLTPDGGLRTGDRGKFDDDGFLFITGRIKEEFKLENGKYVHPAGIEEDIKRIPWIKSALVYGENKPYTVALIVPDFDLLNEVAIKLGSRPQSVKLEHIIRSPSPELMKFVETTIQQHLREKYGGYEIPKKFYLLEEDFTLENGLLTQTLKLKRPAVIKNYKDIIENLYKEETEYI